MELRNLTTFYYASQFLNYSRTAEHLNYSQPAVTLQIKMLEEELNQRLFIRIGKQTYLSPAGEILKKYTESILSDIKNMKEEMELLNNPVGTLTIAADISFCTNNLPPIISAFYQNYPQVKTKIITWNSRRVVQAIEQNEIDAGFISGDYQNEKVGQLIISEDPVVLVASKENFQRFSEADLLEKYPIIKYHTNSPYGVFLDKFLEQNDLSDKNTIDYSNLEAVKSAVLHSVGIAPLTKDIVEQELTDHSLFILKSVDSNVYVKTSMIFQKEKEDWRTIQSLKELVISKWIGKEGETS